MFDELFDGFGPRLNVSREIYRDKYLQIKETFPQAMFRIAYSLSDGMEHFEAFNDCLVDQRFLPAGRVQASIGSERITTPYNCFVSMTIPDSMEGIMQALSEAAETTRRGGGIGFDFSTLRPQGAEIRSLKSSSSGPIAFMKVFDALGAAISSAGHRRAALMGVLRVDHPDIEAFIEAKQNSHTLTNFNISVAVTDAFMDAVREDREFDLIFDGEVYRTVRARELWDKIMSSTWDWAEPGIIFIDRVNRKNNLHYVEQIAAVNPCGEQYLPPHGACLLGSFNLVKYIRFTGGTAWFDYNRFAADIPAVVRAMDNIIDVAIYPLPEQEVQAKQKRRMGLGVTGLANALEVMGHPYGSESFKADMHTIMGLLRDGAYRASIELAKEKGSFPLFEAEPYLQSEFAQTLPKDIREGIRAFGIRNSHLLSVAPTGTISLAADNISSSIEPVFSYAIERRMRLGDGKERVETIKDYGFGTWGVEGRKANDVGVMDHVEVLNIASHYVDSAVSKTCNVGESVSFEEFKDVYLRAYEGGSSGCTTFRLNGKRFGIMQDADTSAQQEARNSEEIVEGSACYIDPNTGKKTCE